MPFPEDYVERVYADVLGKLIGVYLGRPFEGWSYEERPLLEGAIGLVCEEGRMAAQWVKVQP